MFRTESEWQKAYESKFAYWEYSGNPLDPHAEMSSGNHTDLFFNSRKVIPEEFQDETLLRQAAADLIESFEAAGGNISKVDRVVGPATGATILAQFLSDEICARLSMSTGCSWASPAKVNEDGVKRMIFNDVEHMVLPGELVLLCEDVVSTGGSLELTLKATIECGGVILPRALALVNRSGLQKVDECKIIALITRSPSMWPPDACPLCAQGSEAIRPKGTEEWARLTTTH